MWWPPPRPRTPDRDAAPRSARVFGDANESAAAEAAATSDRRTFNGVAVPALSTVLSGGAVTVNISASSAPGTYIMIVRFTSGTTVHEQSVTVTVTPIATRHRAAK